MITNSGRIVHVLSASENDYDSAAVVNKMVKMTIGLDHDNIQLTSCSVDVAKINQR